MDLIFINDLVFSGTHGVHKHEKRQQQRFSVSLSAAVDTRPASKSDQIVDALDYAPLRDIIRDVIEHESYNLIETIAETIAFRVLKDTRIKSVRIAVHKLDIWGNGIPSVIINRPYAFNNDERLS